MAVEAMWLAPQNIRFSELVRVCDHRFGPPRQRITPHRVYRAPRPGDPWVNIQRGAHGRAKAYQVRQALAAIEKLEQ